MQGAFLFGERKQKMFLIKENNTICLTRGDVASLTVTATAAGGGEHTFKAGDVVRFKVFEKGNCENTVLQKDVVVDGDVKATKFFFGKDDTKIGELINKPTDYWYEVEVNPDTEPQTIIGYDENGAKVFRLYPEGSDLYE